jgi:hypothetical protein
MCAAVKLCLARSGNVVTELTYMPLTEGVCYLHTYLASALDGASVQLHPSVALPLPPVTHWIRDWLNLERRFGRGGDETKSMPLVGIEPRSCSLLSRMVKVKL